MFLASSVQTDSHITTGLRQTFPTLIPYSFHYPEAVQIHRGRQKSTKPDKVCNWIINTSVNVKIDKNFHGFYWSNMCKATK